MSLSDHVDPDLDSDLESIAVLFNANDEAQTITVDALAGRDYRLHLAQAAGADDMVKTAEGEGGRFSVPARTTAVFVEFAAAEERLNTLIADVEQLVADGVLKNGNGRALIAKLRARSRRLAAATRMRRATRSVRSSIRWRRSSAAAS